MDMTEKLWGENFLIPSGEIYSFYLYKHNLVSTFIIGGGGGGFVCSKCTICENECLCESDTLKCFMKETGHTYS